MPKTIIDALESAARTQRGIRFMGETPERVSYATLRDEVARVGSALAQRFEVGHPILIVLPNGRAAVTSFLGALYAGLVPSVLAPPRPFADADLFVRGLIAVSRQADDAAIIGSPAVRAMVAEHPAAGHLVTVDASTLDADEEDARPHPVAMLQFTSGSLGDPKGVVLTHDAVLANGEGIGDRLGATEDDVGCYWVPLAHDMGLIGSLVFLMRFGCEQILMTTEHFASDPGAWLRVCGEHGVTLVTGPPFGFDHATRRLLKDLEAGMALPDLSRLRACVVGAEPIDARVLRRVTQALAPTGLAPDPWVMAYGLAEFACVAVAAVGLRTLKVRPASGLGEPVQEDPDGLELTACGAPLSIAELRVVDGQGATLGERVTGRIQVTGRSALSGYWRDLGRSNAALDGRWIVTGDIGFIANGELYVSGREKDVIIVRGRHYFPEEIEHVLQELAHVRPGGVVAYGVVDPSGGPEKVTVVVEIGPGIDVQEVERAIKTRVADRLDLIVQAVIPVAPRQIPRTTSGKPRRGEARRRFG